VRGSGSSRYAARAAYLVLAATLLTGGCTSGPATSVPTGTAESGGTLRLLYDKTFTTWDPQRMYVGPEGALAVRMFTRTLTGYPAGGAGGAEALVGDLATDTGTPADGGKIWSFTIRSGVAWEDGAAVTCRDVAYGIARSFAREQLGGGAPYPMTLLDIPSNLDPSGREIAGYPGPYAVTPPVPPASATGTATAGSTATGTATGTATAGSTATGSAPATEQSGSGSPAFDSAVSCQGPILTLRLKVPTPDFPHIAALPVFSPFRQDRDKGGSGTFDVFSCGPYRLDGPWEPGSGGRFVRNPAWDRATDPLRKAYPDVVDIREAVNADALVQRLTESKAPDHTAIGVTDIPAARQAALLAEPAVAARVSNPPSGTVEMLQLNVKSPVLGNEAVRRALVLATDRDAFVAAYGPRVMTPTTSALAAAVSAPRAPTGTAAPSSATGPAATGSASPSAGATSTGGSGPEAARAVLAAAGVATPVRVRVAYRTSPSADLAYAALKAGWERAGFEVTLEGLGEDYYTIVSGPQAAARFDVFRRSWFADYPAGSAVVPALFDGRMNLSDSGTGQDLGSFNDEAINAAIDAALVEPDRAARARAWVDLDAKIAAAGGFVALGERRRFFLRGTAVAGYADNPLLGGWVDLAAVGVER